MDVINIHEAKTHFSRILQRVAAGEEIVIARAGLPIAKLVPIDGPRPRNLGCDEGLFDLPESFDDDLPAEIIQAFES